LALDELWFDDPLSVAVRSLIENGTGVFQACVPEGVSEERALLIRAGGLVERNPLIETKDGAFELINSGLLAERDHRFEQLLASSPGSVCVVPEFNPRENDPSPPGEASVSWVGGRCYHWIAREDRDTALHPALDTELPWNGYAVISRPAGGAHRAIHTKESGLLDLAASALAISFRAYDGESFWMWSPQEAA